MRRALLIGAVIVGSAVGGSASAQEGSAREGEPAGAGAAAAGEEPSGDERVRALEERLAALEERLAQTEEGEVAAHGVVEHEIETGRPTEEEEAPAPFTIGGWAEAYYAWSFAEPSNGIIDLRGFDNRHNSFNLSNVVLDAHWDYEGVNGRITLQWGSTPATYYLAETNAPSLGTGVGAQSQSLWQLVQQAYVGYRIPIGEGLNVQAGLFLSPIGAEGMAVKDGWFYSRTNLFYGFPFYHTGIRISYPITEQLTATVMLVNGWNTVLDNNSEKTIHAQLAYTIPDLLSANLQYMTGVERPEGAPEGRAWRHLFDLNATLTPVSWLGLMGQITGGFEPNEFGTSSYLAGMLAVRVAPIEWLAISARGDFFWEDLASNAMGTASAIFWPVEWVSSATASVEVRPHQQVSFRLEYRHDEASGNAYFRGTVATDMAGNYIRNTGSQDTLTLGTTAWF